MSRKIAEAGETVDIVHLYAQTEWHSPAAISGSRTGLAKLRDAIDTAISGGTGAARVMTDDGEGYGIAVLCEGPHDAIAWTGEDSDRGMPYSDPLAASPPKRTFWDRVHAVVTPRRRG